MSPRMKLAFMLLVLANLVLFAVHQGVFGDLPEPGREPGRVTRQIEPERIRVLEPREVAALRERAKEQKARDAKSAAAQTVAEITPAACIEFGDFAGDSAARARKRLEKTIDAAGWWLVYIPPQGSRAAVESRAEELRRAGVRELLVVADNSPMRFGIALGSFRDEDVATRHVEDLRRRGIKDVRISDRPSIVPATRFQIRDVDPNTAQQLSAVQKEFAQQRAVPCGSL
jgi:sugar-specific transcriptional regulator TrmB